MTRKGRDREKRGSPSKEEARGGEGVIHHGMEGRGLRRAISHDLEGAWACEGWIYHGMERAPPREGGIYHGMEEGQA